MGKAEIISSIALVISIVSLGFSAYFGLRDRGKLKVYSKFYPASEHGPASMVVVLINTGRRPINLRLIGGTDKEGQWSGTFFDHKNGLTLKEHSRHEINMNQEDLGNFGSEDIIEYEKLWIEDSLGKRHEVKDSKASIAGMRAS